MASIRDILTHIAADVHGASRHTDITRSIWIPSRPSMVTHEGSATSNLGTVPIDNETVTLADAATQAVGCSIIMPADAKATSPLQAVVLWVPAASVGGSTAVRFELTVTAQVAATDVTAAGTTTTFTGANAVKTGNLLQIEAAQQVLASVSALDQIRFYLRRLGSDGADTYTGVVHLLGVRFDYTAGQ